MDYQVKKLILLSTLIFLTLFSYLFYWSFFRREELRSHPANKRSLFKENLEERGRLISNNGVVLAKTVTKNGELKREYPLGDACAHITGYVSLTYGKSGLESSFDNNLSPPPGDEFWSLDETTGKDVILTIDTRLQKKARSLLKQPGAVVAIEPGTGAVKCLYSYPTFDPNSIDKNFQQLKENKQSPLVNRATTGLYPPGSVFKIVTLASYLNSGGKISDVYNAPSEYRVDGFRITNYGNKSFGRITVKKAFYLSINTVFAQLGLKAGKQRFATSAKQFGVEQNLDFPLPLNMGKLPEDLDDPVNLAWASVGQAELLISPFEAALMGSVIANRGAFYSPYITKGSKINKKMILDASTAAQIKEAMVACVEKGTGTRAKIKNLKVAGKTGTAEVEGKEPHSWFVGFAPADNPQIVIAVLVENSGGGGSVATPIFRELLQEYLTLKR